MQCMYVQVNKNNCDIIRSKLWTENDTEIQF